MEPKAPAFATPPGILWIILLGGVGFAAGFFGPMVFSPDANQGPLVGIFLTGPGGGALGLIAFLVMKFRPLAGSLQWKLLAAVAATITLATLIFVQPEPATRGYEVELTVVRTVPPVAVADDVIADWDKRIAQVTWAAPRAGWQSQMRAALAADTGVVVEAVVLRERTVKEHRKPWNRGRVFTTPWLERSQKRRYLLAPGTAVPIGTGRMFIRSDSTERIRPPDVWPPLTPAEFIGYAQLTPLPPAYANLP